MLRRLPCALPDGSNETLCCNVVQFVIVQYVNVSGTLNAARFIVCIHTDQSVMERITVVQLSMVLMADLKVPAVTAVYFFFTVESY